MLNFRPKYEFCQERNCKENVEIRKKNKKRNYIKKTKKNGKILSKSIKSRRIRRLSFGITQATRGPSEPFAQRGLTKGRGICAKTWIFI